jgi:hypothetical protein
VSTLAAEEYRVPVRPGKDSRDSRPARLRLWLWWPVLTVALLHLPTLGATLGSDEGGFAMVAQWLSVPGDHLYNLSWVDRPPLLIGVFKLATLLGPYGTRLVGIAVAMVIVAALGTAARMVGGKRAGAWTAWIGCALAGSTDISTQELNGEIVSAALVSLAILAAVHAVHAVRAPRHWQWTAFGAGAAAAGAALAKQNFVDGLVFVAVFGVLSARSRPEVRARCSSLLRWSAAGVALPVGAALAWAATHGGIGGLVYAMYGFRVDASRLIGHSADPAVGSRLQDLVVASIASGIVPAAICVLVLGARRLRRLDPLAVALLAAFVVELFGVIGGGSYWLHYLIGLIPTVALGAGLAAGHTTTRATRALRVLAVAMVASSLVSNPATALGNDPGSATVAAVSGWLRASGSPGDSLTTLYSHANINYIAGMRPAYPYAWSLPLRVRDPHLDLLSATLSGLHAPTWVLGWDRMDAWNLDLDENLTHALQEHYRPVATVCGKTVWLHNGVTRKLAATPTTGEC